MSKQLTVIIILSLLQSALAGNGTNTVSQYADSLSQYKQASAQLNHEELKDYLKACDKVLNLFQQTETPVLVANPAIQNRIEMRDKILGSPGVPVSVKSILYYEKEAYQKMTKDLGTSQLLYRLSARTLLSNRKYYEQDDDSKASILEIWLNGIIGFTSTELHDLQPDHFGISPWEINARFEPVAFIDQSESTGMLFSLGTLYHFFPEISEKDGQAAARETFSSGYLKRMGFKIGAGGQFPDNFSWHAGLGFQVRAMTAWGLYSFDEKQMVWALGLNDISWIKYLLPY